MPVLEIFLGISWIRWPILLTSVLLVTGCQPNSSNQEVVRIAVASSAHDALLKLQPKLATAARAEVQLLSGASSKLANQIVWNGEVDLFLSAHDSWVKLLEEKNEIDPQLTSFTVNFALTMKTSSSPTSILYWCSGDVSDIPTKSEFGKWLLQSHNECHQHSTYIIKLGRISSWTNVVNKIVLIMQKEKCIRTTIGISTKKSIVLKKNIYLKKMFLQLSIREHFTSLVRGEAREAWLQQQQQQRKQQQQQQLGQREILLPPPPPLPQPKNEWNSFELSLSLSPQRKVLTSTF